VLESPTGSASLRFPTPTPPVSTPHRRHAAHSRLPQRRLLLRPIDLLSAEVAIGSQQDAALFASGEVAIELQNTGAPITFGYPGATISSDFNRFPHQPRRIPKHRRTHPRRSVRASKCARAGTTGLLILGLTIVARRISKR